jgi:hypothetical protein
MRPSSACAPISSTTWSSGPNEPAGRALNKRGTRDDNDSPDGNPLRCSRRRRLSAKHPYGAGAGRERRDREARDSPTGTRNDLSIYTYNEKEHSFDFFGISRDDAEARTTKLTIQGNVWTYWDEADEAGKHIQFRTTNTFQSPATVVWRSEYSEDGAHWILMGEGTDTRRK